MRNIERNKAKILLKNYYDLFNSLGYTKPTPTKIDILVFLLTRKSIRLHRLSIHICS